jgi:hypothetical protein
MRLKAFHKSVAHIRIFYYDIDGGSVALRPL